MHLSDMHSKQQRLPEMMGPCSVVAVFFFVGVVLELFSFFFFFYLHGKHGQTAHAHAHTHRDTQKHLFSYLSSAANSINDHGLSLDRSHAAFIAVVETQSKYSPLGA
jgi:hypothetical protein